MEHWLGHAVAQAELIHRPLPHLDVVRALEDLLVELRKLSRGRYSPGETHPKVCRVLHVIHDLLQFWVSQLHRKRQITSRYLTKIVHHRMDD